MLIYMRGKVGTHTVTMPVSVKEKRDCFSKFKSRIELEQANGHVPLGLITDIEEITDEQ